MPQHILVVDDERTIRELVCELLADEGYDVSGASNGAEALAEIERDDSFSLIVLDMWMPVMNGWQFANALAERGQSVPIIVMTADREARDRANDIGAIGYIGKPFDVDQFVDAVRRALPDDAADAPRRDGTSNLELPAESGSILQFLGGAANRVSDAARNSFGPSAPGSRPGLSSR